MIVRRMKQMRIVSPPHFQIVSHNYYHLAGELFFLQFIILNFKFYNLDTADKE